MNWSPGETVRNPLVKIKHVVLNSPEMTGYQMKLNCIRNNKVDATSEIWFPPKGEHIIL